MNYISTRELKECVSGAEAIVKGLASDGGLFVPEHLPKVELKDILNLAELDYFERAAFIIGLFLDELPKNILTDCCFKAYERFSDDPASLLKVSGNIYFLELWHGPTHAFKDVALTLLPHLLTESKKLLKRTDKTLILTATSGDTGKAALEGFKDVEGTDVIVFYPVDGVSKLQKLQMITQEGDNVKVCAVEGNFDDAQNAVKNIFADKSIADKIAKQGYTLSSANSINWGRLVSQIVYYFSVYADLVESKQIKAGDKINFCVPSGNFGNILAGYYAKKMGLPVNKLICASNDNNVLTDFINGGKYDIDGREFFKTTSPSMDILISSNLERLIFELSGRNGKLTGERMSSLKKSGSYAVSESEFAQIKSEFAAGCATSDEAAAALLEFFDEYGYIMDTHTAVAVGVYKKYAKATNDKSKTVIVSTASPYKFADDVLKAIGINSGTDEMSTLKKLENATALPVPKTLSDLPKLKKRFTNVIKKDETGKAVIEYCQQKVNG